MAANFDPIQFTIRAGPEFNEYGDPWVTICSATVQLDRRLYLYAITGNPTSIKDMKDIIKESRRLAKIFGWIEIVWERRRKDGTIHHARISISDT